jgi:hypothetical protein
LIGFIRERTLAALWAATGVVVVGRLIDLQWHLTHDDFEGAADQIQAHLVVWIGVLLLLFVAAVAVRQGTPGLGYRLVLAGAAFYVPIAVWHFVEHANGSDPELAHVLIGIGYAAMLIGVAAVTFSEFQRRRTSSAEPAEAAGSQT